MLAHVVADYGPAGDLAFAEVTQRLVAALPGATIVATPVDPFDTLAAGFVVAQLALNEGPAERIVFHNVAPRRDEANPRRANEGERFTAAHAPNGTLVVGPNAGHSLSFISDQAPVYLDVPAAGSQFRSRDRHPARPSSSAARRDRSRHRRGGQTAPTRTSDLIARRSSIAA